MPSTDEPIRAEALAHADRRLAQAAAVPCCQDIRPDAGDERPRPRNTEAFNPILFRPDGEPRNTAVAHILQFMLNPNLPEHLQDISRPFQLLAFDLADTLPSNPELTVALRKLLEAKDAAVRAMVAR